MMRRPIEEVVDEALQSLLEGESAEAIAARYPEYADELGSLLFAAGTLRRAPQPQLAQSSLAAMVARAQVQAADDRDRVPVIVPPIAVDSNMQAGELERTVAPQRAARPAPAKKMSWSDRIASWMRPSGPLLRVPGALALVLVLALGIIVVSRLVHQPQPPFIPVPTVSTQFSLDGKIEQMASNMWVVGGIVIYLDADTAISGKASIGSSAHVEGEIASDNRRIARSIVVSPGMSGTTTVAIPSVTAQPTSAAVIGQATVPSTISAQDATSPTAKAEALPSANVAAPRGQITARPTSTVRAAGQPPTAFAPTKAAPTVAPTKPVATSAIPTQAIAQPSRTEAPQPTSTTATEPEPTATSLQEPQPGPASTPTIFTPPTAAPSNTPTGTPLPRPTEEPTDTPEPQPTMTPNPSETPQPEDTQTPRPTIGHPNTPTSLPTSPPLPSPTRSEEPHETHTVEPTQQPPPTGTAEPTRTVQPSETARPSETVEPSQTAQASETALPSQTVQLSQTVQPTQTEHPEETHSPQPTDQPHETETAEPTHHAGQ